MKRVLFTMGMLLLGSVVLFAQKPNKMEVRNLQSFLQQKSARGDTNADRLEISSINSPMTWKGVVWNNGQVQEINWKDKDLAGELNVKGFTALQKLDCSRNKISAINVTGCSSLNTLNISRNIISNLDLTGCSALVKLDCYKNRLTNLDLSAPTSIKNLNCSNNLFVELNVSAAPTLQTLNVQGCHLEVLKVDSCENLVNLVISQNFTS